MTTVRALRLLACLLAACSGPGPSPSAETADTGVAPTTTEASQASVSAPPVAELDPPVARLEDAISGFVAVWADAAFFTEPTDDAPRLSLASFEGAARRERLGFTVAMQVRGAAGDFVEVATPLQESELFGASADSHCGWLHFAIGDDYANATVFVKRRDLAPVLSADYQHTFDDGTSVRLTAGTPVLRDTQGVLAAFQGDALPIGSVDSLAFSYPSTPPPFAAGGKLAHALGRTDDVVFAGAALPLRDRVLGRTAEKVEVRGKRTLMPLRSRCANVVISVPSAEVKAYTPKAHRGGGGMPFGMRGLGGDSVLPMGTPLKSKTGRTVATLRGEVALPQASADPCFDVTMSIGSVFLYAPPLKTSEGTMKLCAIRSAIVKRSGLRP